MNGELFGGRRECVTTRGDRERKSPLLRKISELACAIRVILRYRMS